MDDIFKVRKGRSIPRLGSRVYKVKEKDIQKLVKRAQAITAQLSEVKPLYHELDEITQALMTVREALERKNYGVAIIDNFESKNTCFKTVGIARYSLQWKA